MTAKTPTRQKQKGKRLPHATWTLNTEMKKTLFSQHTYVHNSYSRNYAFMAEKSITSVIQHPVMLWLEKTFYMVKDHNKASSIQFSAALTPKTYGQIDNGVKSTEHETTKPHNH